MFRKEGIQGITKMRFKLLEEPSLKWDAEQADQEIFQDTFCRHRCAGLQILDRFQFE
jgi:hypothetical protein